MHPRPRPRAWSSLYVCICVQSWPIQPPYSQRTGWYTGATAESTTLPTTRRCILATSGTTLQQTTSDTCPEHFMIHTPFTLPPVCSRSVVLGFQKRQGGVWSMDKRRVPKNHLISYHYQSRTDRRDRRHPGSHLLIPTASSRRTASNRARAHTRNGVSASGHLRLVWHNSSAPLRKPGVAARERPLPLPLRCPRCRHPCPR